MRSILSLTVPFFIFLTVSGCATQASRDIQFRGEKLGNAPNDEMKKISDYEESLGIIISPFSSGYVKPDEPLTLGHIAIKYVLYEYHQDKLYQITVKTAPDNSQTCPNRAEIVQAIENNFAIKMKWFEEDHVQRSYLAQWRGNGAWVTYNCMKENGGEHFSITHGPTFEKIFNLERAKREGEMNDRSKVIERSF